jgi:apolipoprotein N-acyltransferase
VALVGALTIAEAARWSFPWEGVPLATLAMGQADSPFVTVARLGGALAVSALVAIAGVALSAAVGRRTSPPGTADGRTSWRGSLPTSGQRSWRTAAIAASVVVVAIVAGTVAPSGAPVGDLQVAAVQGGGPQRTRATTSDAGEVFDRHLSASRTITTPVDLVVWPEGASPYDLEVDGRRHKATVVLGDLARSGGFDLLVGAGTRTREPDPAMGEDRISVFNSVYHIGRDGEVKAHYDKMVPLPFGEYLPFAWAYPWLAKLLPVGDFRPGEAPVFFDAGGLSVATPICYEAILPRTCRQFASADLLVTVTNDAWFGDTANPWQHAMLAATRAVELGVPMVRSAYTGVSFVVEPHGRIHHETQPFQTVNRPVEVRNTRAPTWYARFGDWFVLACALGLAGAVAATKRRPGAPSPT